MTADVILGLVCGALAVLITAVLTASWLADKRKRLKKRRGQWKH